MTKTMKSRLLRKAVASQTKELKIKGFEFEGISSKDGVVFYNPENDIAFTVTVTVHKEGFDFMDKIEEFEESEKKRLEKAKEPDPENPFIEEEAVEGEEEEE